MKTTDRGKEIKFGDVVEVIQQFIRFEAIRKLPLILTTMYDAMLL